jgi:TatA/E family protein of Tat protein translocase
MPFNLSMTHLMVVGVVALVILGPERLPGVARTAGQFYREFKRIRGDLEGEVREVIADFKEPFLQEVHAVASDLRTTITQAPPADAPPPLPGGFPPLAPDTALVSPGPPIDHTVPEIPLLGPPPAPGMFTPRET